MKFGLMTKSGARKLVDQRVAAAQRELANQAAAARQELIDELAAQKNGQELTLLIFTFLTDALHKAIGANVTEERLDGKVKIATIGNVCAQIDGFNHCATLVAQGPRSEAVPPVTLYFGDDGRLTQQAQREFSGFLRELSTPLPSTPFFGSEAVA